MFRFTIRDVLWLMVVVGLAVGWVAHWTKSATHERDLGLLPRTAALQKRHERTQAAGISGAAQERVVEIFHLGRRVLATVLDGQRQLIPCYHMAL